MLLVKVAECLLTDSPFATSITLSLFLKAAQ